MSIGFQIAIFVAAAIVVWIAGSRLTRYVDAISTVTGLGHALLGMLLLGGITSLAEISTVTTSAWIGNAPLAVNTLLGSSAVNIILLALADALYGRAALTSAVGKPTTLFQGTLGMMILVLTAMGVMAGEVSLGPVGLWSSLIMISCFGAIWLSSRYSGREPWTLKPHARAKHDAIEENGEEGSLRALILKTAAAGAAICVAGYFLSNAADAIAQQTGIGASLVGLILVGFATSLPEVSSLTTAVRIGRYELAISNIFGTNLFNLTLIFLADAVYAKGPVLASAGPFEAVAALLAALITGVYVLGLLEHKDRTILRVGYDSAAAIAIFIAGLAVLVPLSNQ